MGRSGGLGGFCGRSGSSGYEVFRLSRAGFYDYRLVSISLERGVQVLKKGRLLCQPPVQNEMVHQVWVDVDSALWNERSNLLTKTSTFDDLEKRVPIFKRMGVTWCAHVFILLLWEFFFS